MGPGYTALAITDHVYFICVVLLLRRRCLKQPDRPQALAMEISTGLTHLYRDF